MRCQDILPNGKCATHYRVVMVRTLWKFTRRRSARRFLFTERSQNHGKVPLFYSTETVRRAQFNFQMDQNRFGQRSLKSTTRRMNPKVGMRIEVYWPLEKKFFSGTLVEYNSGTGKYRIDYDDGDSEDLNLSKEKWKELPSVAHIVAFNSGCIRRRILLKQKLEALLQECRSKGDHQFRESRRKELEGLIEKGVFEVVKKSEVTGRVFGSRFVDEMKNRGTPEEYPKSRMVVQAYDDKNHGLLTHAPTVRRSSQRLFYHSQRYSQNGRSYSAT